MTYNVKNRRTWLTFAVLLVAIALAAVPTFTPIGNKQLDKCMGYNKTKPDRTQPSLSTGSCKDTPSNSVTLWNANGKGGPIVDQKKQKCVTAASNKPGAAVDGKPCKAVPKKDRRRRRDDGEDNKDGDVPDFVLHPEEYEWPPQQQWFKISNTSTEFEESEIWKNGYGLCLEVTPEGFFRQYTCDPNNPNQNWFINYTPQPEPEAPVATPPVIVVPVQTPVVPTCPPIRCPQGMFQDMRTCQCVCYAHNCPGNQYQDPYTCDCKCRNHCHRDEIQDPYTCECQPKCEEECSYPMVLNRDCDCVCPRECPYGQKQLDDCSCICLEECPYPQVQDKHCQCFCPKTFCHQGEIQNPETCECECLKNTCPGNQVQNMYTCKCECPNSCMPDEDQDPITCECESCTDCYPSGCRSNQDCPPWNGSAQVCHNGQCVPAQQPGSCASDDDCDKDTACEGGMCVLVTCSNPSCVYCVHGQCID